MDNKVSAIIIGMLIILSSGTTYVLTNTGKNIACKTSWIFQSDNGNYACQLSTSVKYNYCSNVYDSANTKNYWCTEATVVLQNSTQPNVQYIIKCICDKTTGCQISECLS